MIRVLFLNQYYWPDSAATAQLLTDLAEHLARACDERQRPRFHVDVVCSRRAYHGHRKLLPAHDVRHGVHIHRVDAPLTRLLSRSSTAARGADAATFHALAGARVLTLPRPDVCVAMTSPPLVGALGAALRRMRSTRLLVWLMDMYPDVATALSAVRPGSLPHRLAEQTAQAVYRAADRIVTPCYAMTNRLKRAGVTPEKLTTVPNWAPNERTPRPAPESRRGRLHLMYSGNLGLAHEFDTVFEAASSLRHRDHVRFTFAGRGPQLERLQAEAKRRDLMNVTFMPSQSLEALPDFLADGDVHLVTMHQRAEGLVAPSKLYGILAAGRPALFVGPTNNQIARTLNAAQAGWTITPGQTETLTHRIERILADPRLAEQAGRKGQEYYFASCTRARRCQTLEHLIAQLVSHESN